MVTINTQRGCIVASPYFRPFYHDFIAFKLLVDGYLECQAQMENGTSAHNATKQLVHILQTPEDVKGFFNFALQVEGFNVTDCRLDHLFIGACKLLVLNPTAAYIIQVL